MGAELDGESLGRAPQAGQEACDVTTLSPHGPGAHTLPSPEESPSCWMSRGKSSSEQTWDGAGSLKC